MKRGIATLILCVLACAAAARVLPFRVQRRGGDWMPIAMTNNNILRLDFTYTATTNFTDTSYRANSCISTSTATAPTWSSGTVWFDGTNDSISYGTGASVRAQSAASVAVWIKPQYTNSANVVSETTVSFGYFRMGLSLGANGVISFTIRDGAADPQGTSLSLSTTNNAYAVNAWRHIVATCDSATEERAIYLDGTLSTSTTATAFGVFSNTASASRRLGILDNVSSLAIPFRGYEDGVYIFDRALTAAEAQLIHDSTKGDSRP